MKISHFFLSALALTAINSPAYGHNFTLIVKEESEKKNLAGVILTAVWKEQANSVTQTLKITQPDGIAIIENAPPNGTPIVLTARRPNGLLVVNEIFMNNNLSQIVIVRTAELADKLNKLNAQADRKATDRLEKLDENLNQSFKKRGKTESTQRPAQGKAPIGEEHLRILNSEMTRLDNQFAAGLASYNQSDYALALAELKKSSEDKERYNYPLKDRATNAYWLAMAADGLGDFPESTKWIEKARLLDPQNEIYQLWAAKMFATLGDVSNGTIAADRALKTFEELLVKQPDQNSLKCHQLHERIAHCLTAKASLLTTDGKFDIAKLEYERALKNVRSALKIHKECPASKLLLIRVLKKLGSLYYTLNQPAQGEAAYLEAESNCEREKVSGQPFWLQEKGHILLCHSASLWKDLAKRKNLLRECGDAFKQALVAGDRTTFTHFNLATSYVELSRIALSELKFDESHQFLEDGRKEVKTSLQLAPSYEAARLLNALIYQTDGDLAQAEAKPLVALKNYRDGLELLNKLSREPGNLLTIIQRSADLLVRGAQIENRCLLNIDDAVNHLKQAYDLFDKCPQKYSVYDFPMETRLCIATQMASISVSPPQITASQTALEACILNIDSIPSNRRSVNFSWLKASAESALSRLYLITFNTSKANELADRSIESLKKFDQSSPTSAVSIIDRNIILQNQFNARFTQQKFGDCEKILDEAIGNLEPLLVKSSDLMILENRIRLAYQKASLMYIENKLEQAELALQDALKFSGIALQMPGASLGEKIRKSTSLRCLGDCQRRQGKPEFKQTYETATTYIESQIAETEQKEILQQELVMVLNDYAANLIKVRDFSSAKSKFEQLELLAAKLSPSNKQGNAFYQTQISLCNLQLGDLLAAETSLALASKECNAPEANSTAKLSYMPIVSSINVIKSTIAGQKRDFTNAELLNVNFETVLDEWKRLAPASPLPLEYKASNLAWNANYSLYRNDLKTAEVLLAQSMNILSNKEIQDDKQLFRYSLNSTACMIQGKLALRSNDQTAAISKYSMAKDFLDSANKLDSMDAELVLYRAECQLQLEKLLPQKAIAERRNYIDEIRKTLRKLETLAPVDPNWAILSVDCYLEDSKIKRDLKITDWKQDLFIALKQADRGIAQAPKDSLYTAILLNNRSKVQKLLGENKKSALDATEFKRLAVRLE